MVRTQIQLTEKQADELKKLAKKKNVSMARLIRDSVDNILTKSRPVRSEEVKRRAMAAAGSLRSGVPDLATNHDTYLAEAYDS